jgi:hypothetical protein
MSQSLYFTENCSTCFGLELMELELIVEELELMWCTTPTTHSHQF